MASAPALRRAISAAGRMKPPKDPVPKKKPKTGATGEGSGSTGGEDYYWSHPSEQRPASKGGMNAPQKPTKTTEGREPWQYDTNGQTPAEGAPRLTGGPKPKRNRRYS